MKVIGITGGIGSGKSLVSRILQQKGFFIYNADERARFLMNNDEDLKNAIKNLFGEAIYTESGLNRKLVAQFVFNNNYLLNSLNQLVHPKVKKDFEFWKVEQKNQSFVFKESAIIYETESQKYYDLILLVTADLAIRLQRVIQRDQTTKEEVLKRIQNQLDEDKKIELADFIIYNNKTIEDLNLQVDDFLINLKSKFKN